METITIVYDGLKVVVVDGRVSGAHLKYWGSNLEVYVKGAIPVPVRDKIHYHAMEQARARHIPLKAFYSKGWT